MHRFFLTKDQFEQDKILLKGDTVNQISHVLRLKPTDHIILLDNNGWEYDVEIEQITREQVKGKVINKKLGQGEPVIKIKLYQALLKADKFELVLQKGVELGITEFVPYISERCVTKKPSESKVARWRKIVQEAAEQSERTLLPILHHVVSFTEACNSIKQPTLLFWEEERKKGLKQILQNPTFKSAKSISIFIGPEGGFPASEVQLAKQHGIAVASLGKRVLRAETAGLAAISAILYEKGEMGKNV